jgi:hypothetical protein
LLGLFKFRPRRKTALQIAICIPGGERTSRIRVCRSSWQNPIVEHAFSTAPLAKMRFRPKLRLEIKAQKNQSIRRRTVESEIQTREAPPSLRILLVVLTERILLANVGSVTENCLKAAQVLPPEKHSDNKGEVL